MCPVPDYMGLGNQEASGEIMPMVKQKMKPYYQTELGRLYHGDCLEVMPNIPDKSVDCVCADIPYGTTCCKWDNVIPFEPMWEQLNRIIKPNGAIVLFGSEPFSSALRMSNIKNYKYDWVWNKRNCTGEIGRASCRERV